AVLRAGSAVVSTALVGVSPTSWQHSPWRAKTVSGICRTRLFGETPNRATETVALRFLKFFRCSVPLLSSVFRPYVERSQTVPVSLDRAEVAESLGRTANLLSAESGRRNSTGTPVRQAPRSRSKIRECRATPAETLHPRHVPVPVGRRPARRASGRLHRDGHSGALQARPGFSRAPS